MKKFLCFLMALCLMLSVTNVFAEYTWNKQVGNGTHTLTWVGKNPPASNTDITMLCDKVKTATTTYAVTPYESNGKHVVKVTVTTPVCSVCGYEHYDETKVTEHYEDHKLVIGAYLDSTESILLNNDYTHRYCFDNYEAVCSICGAYTIYQKPIYVAHDMKNGVCQTCGYKRQYKAPTKTAVAYINELVPSLEKLGAEVVFDEEQLVAVGIVKGVASLADYEGLAGCADIKFTNYTYDKGNNKQIIAKTETTQKAVNITQDSKVYHAAYVTVFVDGAPYRIYFYQRHDKNDWSYAYTVEMHDPVLLTFDNGTFVRCGAGLEYAPVANGTAYAGSALSYGSAEDGNGWVWEMIDDFSFIALSKCKIK